MIISFEKGVCWATAARQPTLIIVKKVTVRTRTIDLNVLLGATGTGSGMDIRVGVDASVDGSESLLNFSVEPLPSNRVFAKTSSMQPEPALDISFPNLKL